VDSNANELLDEDEDKDDDEDPSPSIKISSTNHRRPTQAQVRWEHPISGLKLGKMMNLTKTSLTL
jgi:hypothetical protein